MRIDPVGDLFRRKRESYRLPPTSFADRVGDLITLSTDERTALVRLEERERPLRSGAVLLREKDPLTELFVLKRGTMMTYVLLDDGSRQILRFCFPGDLLGDSAFAFRESRETIAALSDCVVATVDRAAVRALIAAHPRLGALLLAVGQIERLALTERLAGLGRTSARTRVAALLLDLRDRMRRVDPSITTSFAPGLTQEEIGDATGLTAVHVNRMLRRLELDGLIARTSGRVTLLNEAALVREANYVDHIARLDLGWLSQR
jgi:CRP/FNR family transcriptional regulator